MSVLWQLLDGPVIHADCVEAMRAMPDRSVDAIVTDPPYELGFMGKAWDASGVAYQTETWAEALRVLKPGGHLLAFGGTRTYHRLACAIEDAGFEIRDSLMWLYGSGFPKSLNVSLAIDKAAGGADRGRAIPVASKHFPTGRYAEEELTGNAVEEYEPQSAAAAEWEGWGTALKPGYEPIVMARRPLEGTVAANVLAHGTGALHIDACRVGFRDEADERESKEKNRHGDFGTEQGGNAVYGDYSMLDGRGNYDAPGRWPVNLALSHTERCVRVGSREVASDGHFPGARGPSGYGSNGRNVAESKGGGLLGQSDLDERHLAGETVETWECASGCPIAELDAQSGTSRSPGGRTANISKGQRIYGSGRGLGQDLSPDDVRGDPGFGDTGGASRFFYTAKAGRAERSAGLEGFEKEPLLWSAGDQTPGSFQGTGTDRAAKNFHPTVKPIELIRWLLRLVTPPGGVVLDMFAGSGTTLCAGAMEGIDVIGVEMNAEYVGISLARYAWWLEHPEGVETEKVFAAERRRAEVAAAGQGGLF